MEEIPKVIHRYWEGPLPQHARFIKNSLAHPGWEIKEWSPMNFPIKLPGRATPRQRSNIARYWLLYAFGGWWLDSDVMLFRPLESLPQVRTVADLNGNPEGCLIAAPPWDIQMGAAHYEAVTADLSISLSTGQPLLAKFVRGYRREPRIFPLDASGTATGVEDLIGVHLWNTSSGTHDYPKMQKRIRYIQSN